MATSLNSIMDVNPQLRKAVVVEQPKPGFAETLNDLQKAGMRHGKKDKAIIQKAHDAMSELVGGVHCVMGDSDATAKAAHADALEKANARHSKKDMEEIQKCHDMIKGLGADCPMHKDEA